MMKTETAFRDARLLESLDHIDRRFVAEVTDSLKIPESTTAPDIKRSPMKSLKYVAAVAACALLMSTIIPVIDYVTTNLHSFFPGFFETEDTVSEENTPETLPPETVQTESGLLLRPAEDGITYGVVGIGTYSDTHLVIPDSYNGIPITSIGLLSLSGAHFVETVTLPGTLTNISSVTFANCNKIRYNVHDGVKYLGNEENPYEYLITADDDVITHTAPAGTRFVSDYAFANNTELKSIAFSNVEYIGSKAFDGCNNLESVEIGESLLKIYSSAFNSCKKLYDINLPDSLESIGASAFSGCHSLTQIKISDKITTIEFGAFKNCISLRSVSFGNNLVSIKNRAFQNCVALEKVDFPKSLIRIGRHAFRNTAQLHVTIYPGVEEIYSDSFDIAGVSYGGAIYIGNASNPYCYMLKVDGITTDPVIHKDAQHFAYGALVSDYKIKSVSVDARNEHFASSGNCIIEKESKTLVCGVYPCVIPDDGSVTSIGQRAFAGSETLEEITIPDSVKKIGSYAFYQCNALKSAEIPRGVEEIGDYAFEGCKLLNSDILLDAIRIIGDCSFNYCESLKKVHLGNSLEYMGYEAFGSSGIESIVLPATLTDIPENAFHLCSALKEVTIMGKNVTVGGYAFNYCSVLSSINLENVVIIRDGAFDSCGELTEIALSDNLVHIGNGAFDACGFTEIIIPDGVKSIGDDVFSYSKLIKTPDIPDSVEEFGDKVYYSCDYLISASIPKIKTRLVSSELADCHSLKEVYLHSDIEYIEDGAFYYSKALEKIYYDGTVAEWEAIEKEELWYRCTSGIKVICTDGTLDIPENWTER